jgi:hypothetical protein
MKRGTIYNMAGLLLFSLGWTACGDEFAVELSPVQVSISVPFTESKGGLQAPLMAPAPDPVNSIEVAVSGSDFATVTELLVRDVHFTTSTDPVLVEIMVPVGIDRIFTAQAYGSFEGTGTPLYKGSTTGVEILLGTNEVRGIFLFVPPFVPPTIGGATPNPVCVNTTLTIAGTDFDPIAANNSVLFLGKPGISNDDEYGVVTNATPIELQVTVPIGAKSGDMLVHNLVGTSTSPYLVGIQKPNACP